MTLRYANTNSEKLFIAFQPVYWFLTITGQCWFLIVKRGTVREPLYTLEFKRISTRTAVYGLVFGTFSIFFILITVGFLVFFFNGKALRSPDQFEIYDPISRLKILAPYEVEISRREMIPLLVIYGWMLITFIGFITAFVKGRVYAHYFNFWNRVVQIIDIDATPGVKRFTIGENVICGCVMVLILATFLYELLVTNHTMNSMYAFGNIYLRLFRLNLQPETPSFNFWLTITFIIMLYSYLGSRVSIIQFLFFSQLLRNASSVWNQRLRNLVQRVELTMTKQSNRRVDYASILKDHLILVQLFKKTEYTFSTILISYYIVNFINIMLELYLIISTLLQPLKSTVKTEALKWNGTEFSRLNYKEMLKQSGESITSQEVEAQAGSQRIFSVFVSLMLLCYQCAVVYYSIVNSSRAYEHAMKGFEVLRRYGFMQCRNKTERNFVHSLVFSFARNNPILISGGGYFSLTRPLFVAMAANMFNFVVLMNQIQPNNWGDLEYA